MSPNQIPLGVYTHLNYAFVSIDPTTFRIVNMDSFTGSLYSQITALKLKDPTLEVWVSVGGWSFNDPGSTATTFSTLSRDTNAQQAFFASLITFMVNNGFDGVDIDWYAAVYPHTPRKCADWSHNHIREYPVAPERGGSADDFENFPKMLRNLRTAMNGSGFKLGLSITLVSGQAVGILLTTHSLICTQPSSYWYLRGFDIVAIDPVVDFLNLMTYDLHGTWDGTDPYIGAVALAHTNLTEIQQSLDLLWRNNINPSKVNLGIGFYGRSTSLLSLLSFAIPSRH